MKPYEGSQRVRSLAFHKAGAPWPTCSCPHCRHTRRVDAERTGTLESAVQRTRAIRARIYGELRDRPDPGVG